MRRRFDVTLSQDLAAKVDSIVLTEQALDLASSRPARPKTLILELLIKLGVGAYRDRLPSSQLPKIREPSKTP
jgi:hypothetical protein